MSYGVITPKFNSTKENLSMVIHNHMSSNTVLGVTDTLREKHFHVVHDSRNIGKGYGTLENTIYICKDQINYYVVGPAYTYYNFDQFKKFDQDIVIDKSIKYGLETADRPIRHFFSTRARYMRIIDQVYFSTMFDADTVACNFKFSYVKRIGVALPASIFGDSRDNYPDDYSQVFNVFNNSFQVTFYNRSERETIVTRPFEIHNRQVSNNQAVFGSPAYIFDLSSL